MPLRTGVRGGMASPLAIALSSIGAGLQGYGRERDTRLAREEDQRQFDLNLGRLNENEQYRRKLDAITQQRALQDKAQRVADLMGTPFAQSDTPIGEPAARAIVAGDISPSDLFRERPVGSTPPPRPTGNAAAEAARRRREGTALLAEYAPMSTRHTPEEKARFDAAFQRIKAQNPGIDDGMAAYDAHQALRSSTAQAGAESRLTPRVPNFGRRPTFNPDSAMAESMARMQKLFFPDTGRIVP